MSNLALLNRAASATTCQLLSTFGQGLVGAAVWPLWAPQGRLVALGAGSLSMLAANYLCPPMDIDNAPGPADLVEGCGQILPGGYGQFQYNSGGGWVSVDRYEWFTKAQVIENTYIDRLPSSGKWTANASVTGIGGGSPYAVGEFDTEDEANQVRFRIDPTNGSCAYDPEVPIPPPPNDIDTPIVYNDNETNCEYTVSLQGFAQVYNGGPANPVFIISASGTERAGGRVGGCNFNPVIYMPMPGGDGGGGGGGSDGGGPGITFPVPDGGPPSGGGEGGDVPWWLPPLVAGSTSAALGLIGDAINDLLQPTLPEGSYTLQAPCDVDEEGNALTQTWTYPEQTVDERLIAHQITMLEALQTHLNWKTPTCESEPTIPDGDFRTISFRSDETSPYGKSRLRKRFRYRSVSGNDLGAVVDHWKDFSFEGGPCRVRWIGRTWGPVEVWASTEAEGKRVIQHAAAEAGFSPLEDGRWSARVTRSSRLGVPSTMRVDTTKGFYWITARDGSDNRPIVAKT